MLVLGTDIQKYVIIIKISAEWFELRIHLDKSKFETLQRKGLLDCAHSLDQGGNAMNFETFNSN